MTTQPDDTTAPPDPRLSRATRVTLATLGCLALALGGAGAAYAGSLGTASSGETEDSAWVTVVEDDAENRTVDCPADAAGTTEQDTDTDTNTDMDGDGL